MSKSLLVVGLIAALGGNVVRAQFTDSVVARVQDEVITAYEVFEESQRQEEYLRRELVGQELETALGTLRNQTAVRLIEQELVYADFQTLGVEVPGAMVQQRLDQFVKSQADGDRVKFEALLEEREMTLKEFEEKLKRALAIELLVRERVRRNIDISPTQVNAYFAEHRAEFAQPEQVRLETIVIKADGKHAGKQDATVTQVLADLAGGKPFGEVARTYSEGPFAEQGGDRGWQETTKYGDKLIAIIAQLTPGAVSQEPLKMGDDAYIVRLAERRGGGEAKLDADLQQKIQDILSQTEDKTRYRSLINELRQKYFVKVFDRDLAAFWDSL